jgi:glycosyltransferase involved in cell wall biosynthesis
MNKKIAFVYTSPFPAKRGFSAADRRVRDLIRGLIHAGANVTLFIPYYHKILSLDSHNEDFEIIYIGNKKFIKSLVINRYFYWKQLYFILIKDKFETVFLYNTQADSIPFVKLIKRKGIRIIYEICDFHSHSENLTLKSYLSSLTEKYLPENADLVITISDFLKDLIINRTIVKNILIIPILVDTDFFQNKSGLGINYTSKFKEQNDDFIISYVGGLWKHQGVRYLMEAFKKLIDNGYRAKLLIAGNYDSLSPNKDDVVALSKEIGIKDNIILPGWVSTEEVKNILYSSDLLVISQTNDLFTQAGLPTKLAEYAACGKLILSTNVGDVTKYFKDKYNCILCLPSDVDSMYEGIKFAITNTDEITKISLNAYNTCNDYFDYKVNGEIILKKINSL